MNVKRKTTRLIPILLIVSLMSYVIPALAIPIMPHRFYGEVTVNEVPAVDGTLIEANIEGVTYANTTTVNGAYGYMPNVFDVPGDDSDTPEKEGGENGDTVKFYVAGTYAASYTFQTGTSTKLDLSIAAPSPTVNFIGTPTSGSEPLTVQFNDTSVNFENITSWSWSFGDNNTSLEQNPEHTYTSDGNYTVSLTVVGDGTEFNLTETKTDYIQVYDSEPKAGFYGEPLFGAPPLTVQFTDQTESYDGITSRVWNFGDNQTSIEHNPVHTYIGGVYTVSLNVTEADGDWDVEIKPNYVTATTNVTAPAKVMMDVGSIHFPGETAEFYIFTLSDKGLPVNVEFLEVRLLFYYNEENHYVDLATPVHVEAGVYRVAYEIPETGPPVTYTLVTRVQCVGPEGMSYGGAVKSFQVSDTLTGWNASITKIEGDIATILVPKIGQIQANLTTINAELVDLKAAVATIETDIGTIIADLADINAKLVSIDDGVATISTTVGSIKTSVDNIGLKVDSISGDVATIKTDLGTISGKVTSIDGSVATIKTDIGTVKADVSDLTEQFPVTFDMTPVWIAVILSLIAAIAAIIAVVTLRQKIAS